MNPIDNISIYKPKRSVSLAARSIVRFPRHATFWRSILELRLATESLMFVIANFLDVVLTFFLLKTGAFREANPLANFVLENWGMIGMVGFKFAFVAGIVMIAQFIATRQFHTARALLNLGTLIVGCVVIYSSYLFAEFLQLI